MGFYFDEGLVAHRTQSFILSNLPQYHPRIAAFGLELCPMDSAPSLNLAMNLPSNSNRKFRVQVLNCQFPTPIETSRSSSLILYQSIGGARTLLLLQLTGQTSGKPGNS